jgi:two-component system nitrogen regulation response regulator NtrX
MHKILIVDDEAGIRESLSGVLADEGYSASSVESGEACLELLRKAAFDVVLLDVWLPGVDGLETLEKIRELESAPEATATSRPQCAPPSWERTTSWKNRFRSTRR